MSASFNQELGNHLPPHIDRFLERDWLLFRVWVLVFGLGVFGYGIYTQVQARSQGVDIVEGKVSKSLASDLANLYLVLTHRDPNSIKNIEYESFNTISGETGARFFQLSMNYEELELDGSYQPIQKDLFFDESGWAEAFGTLN